MSEALRPTLLSSCARAATAEEARFRVNYPNSRRRRSRIFALDVGAAETMYAISDAPWNDAHFLTVIGSGIADPDRFSAAALPLAAPDGTRADLATELEAADLVVLLASTASNPGAAEVIAREAFHRKTMIAALALGQGLIAADLNSVVAALRPFASVLVVATDLDYVPAMLTALRA